MNQKTMTKEEIKSIPGKVYRFLKEAKATEQERIKSVNKQVFSDELTNRVVEELNLPESVRGWVRSEVLSVVFEENQRWDSF